MDIIQGDQTADYSAKLIDLPGNWRKGWALCYHTIESKRLPDGSFDTKRTEIGEMLYQLKYRSDRSKIEPLARIVSLVIRYRLIVYPYLSAIVPVPPSKQDREFQPVYEIAKLVGEYTDIPVRTDYLIKTRETPELKDLEDTSERKRILEGSFAVKDLSLKGKKVLLFDDIFRSGETLMECTKVLLLQGKVENVYVLTLTKTRKKN